MKVTKEILICKQGTGAFDKYKYALCSGCPFLYTHLANHYLDDVVVCRCDAILKKGQKFTIGSRCRPMDTQNRED